MNNLILLITFISLLFYLGNIIADFTYDRPVSTHLGYGIISIITTYQIEPILSLILIIANIIWSALMLGLWLESKKSKRHA